MRKLFLVSLAIVLAFSIVVATRGDELDDISKQLNDLKRDLTASQQATKPLESDLVRLQKQFDAIKARITTIEHEVDRKEQEVRLGEEALTTQKKLLDNRIGVYYKQVKKTELSLVNLFLSDSFSYAIRNFFYQKSLADQDKQSIVQIVTYIKGLEDRKKTLESEKSRLAEVKASVDKQSQFLSGEVGKAKKYQSELSSKIASLSARQQQLVAQKLSSLGLPRSASTGAKGCADDRSVDPGFSPRLAFFTFGVPNRVGMNQYGALGRAKAGQNEEDILRAYYDNFELKKDYDSGINISVDGYGSYNIEDYVKRIYEIPGDWPMAALKAQAVAARSYALSYTGNGARSICTTQQCQVFKPDPKGGAWEQAVNETKGWVMVQGGSPIKAWFSSTHGGYVLKSGEIGWSDTSWTKHATDTTSGSAGSFADLQSNAYDRESPWFYCDWGARPQYNKTAWLKPDEVADIANSISLAKLDGSVGEHLYQPDKPNPAGTDTWDQERIKSELKNRGGNPLNRATDVSINADFGAGRSTSVTISGDGVSATFDAREFKDWFNLRAPQNIQIVGPLFNIEKR